MKKIKLATVFSGIGAIEQALLKRDDNYEIVFASDNGEIELNNTYEEIIDLHKKSNVSNINDFVKEEYRKTGKINYVKKSYFNNYSISEDKWYEDIRFIDGTKYNKQVDILVGGSPCQSFSIIGKKAGLEDARGTLFYDFARLIKEIEPRVFIYENVTGMMSHDKGKTWKHIQEIFDSLGYQYKFKILNSLDYGIPQSRNRIFVVGWCDKEKNFEFPQKRELSTTMFDYLDTKVAARHYLGKKGFEFVTNPKYKNRAQVNSNIIRTQKANQQFNWNGDFVFEPISKVINDKEIMDRAHVGIYNGVEGVIRQLNYRESLRLMGFSDNFKVVVPNVPAYRQIGNSIVVNILEDIISELFKLEII